MHLTQSLGIVLMARCLQGFNLEQSKGLAMKHLQLLGTQKLATLALFIISVLLIIGSFLY